MSCQPMSFPRNSALTRVRSVAETRVHQTRARMQHTALCSVAQPGKQRTGSSVFSKALSSSKQHHHVQARLSRIPGHYSRSSQKLTFGGKQVNTTGLLTPGNFFEKLSRCILCDDGLGIRPVHTVTKPCHCADSCSISSSGGRLGPIT